MLAQIRLQEAQALLKAGLPDGAYYLAGYSIECALKACIAKSTRRYDFPPDKKTIDAIYVHNLKGLMKPLVWKMIALHMPRKIPFSRTTGTWYSSGQNGADMKGTLCRLQRL